MPKERVREPIRVLAVFSGGEIDPVRFRWNGREVDIFSITARWQEGRGVEGERHFRVQAEDGTYLLRYAGRELQWWLDEVASGTA